MAGISFLIKLQACGLQLYEKRGPEKEEPEEEWFWQFKPFSKLKTAFREYWTSIKIKINMICVSKEYEIKTKMEREQWLQLKMLSLLVYNLKTVV